MGTSTIGQVAATQKNIASLLNALSKSNDGDSDDSKRAVSAQSKVKAAVFPGVGQNVDKLA